MKSYSVPVWAFGSTLSHVALKSVSNKCVHILFLRTAWNPATQRHPSHTGRMIWQKCCKCIGLRPRHSLPSCQPLPRRAEAYKGTTERNDSLLEAWQQPTGCGPDKPQQLFSFCLLSCSLYILPPSRGNMTDLSLTTAATYFGRFICNHRLSPSAFTEGFFCLAGSFVRKVLTNTNENAALGFVLLPTKAAVFEFGGKWGKIKCRIEWLSFSLTVRYTKCE